VTGAEREEEKMAGKGRQFTPDDKLKILEEARRPGTTVSEVLRRHQLDTNTFYRWEKQAREGMRAAFTTTRGSGESSAKDREIERLKAELVKKSRIIAEVIEENLEMKKKL
jgi:transposase-like protein